jgi:hypothetical protein
MDMNQQKCEISNMQNGESTALELTTVELENVSGGANAELLAAFYSGIVKGFLEAGGTVNCNFRP